jgi:hypothetical protein
MKQFFITIVLLILGIIMGLYIILICAPLFLFIPKAREKKWMVKAINKFEELGDKITAL